MRWLKRILGGAVALIILCAVSGAVYQTLATQSDEARFAMPGERVDIGGRRLHIYCTGAGPVTVVLEAGLTANYSAWLLVQRGLTPHTRVCSYDRAGMGFSDAATNPSRTEFVVEDLQHLLRAAGLAPPYLLVGWSAGGVFVRHFYQRYPHGVVAMLLIDSSHEQQAQRLPQVAGAAPLAQLRLCRAIAWTGAVRLSGAMAQLTAQPRLPPDVAGTQLALYNRSNYCAGVLHEIEGFTADLADMPPPGSLGDLRLTVLSRGRPSSPADFGDAAVDARLLLEMDRRWAELQVELAHLSTRATHQVLADTGHAIPLEAPARVIAAVTALLDQPVLAAPRE
jgi:pimeloyl-ACP methyl ester carboxylesterase